ncbi:MAG: 4a-hydroxytetrahydrobiopterin dehydratase [Actinomycetota bacterium]
MPKLSDEDIRAAVAADLPGWEFDGDAIHREFVFKGFMAAIAFIGRLATKAHEARHHPDLENHYNRVLVSLSTHDEGGVTEHDIALARAIESVVEPPEA